MAFPQVLSAREIDEIHRTSMAILARTGVDMPDEEAIAVFKKHGVRTDGSRVYPDEAQIREALRTAPARFTIAARNPARAVTVGGGEPVFVPGYGAPFLVDVEVGRRTASMDDYHDLVRLAHALPNQDMSGYLLVEPGDVAPDTAHLHMLFAHIAHSDKPFVGSAAGTRGAENTMAMASILFGAALEERPVTIALVNSRSPLAYSTEMLEALRVYARRRQPLVIAALAMAGSTGPVTLAGVLAMQNAELLAGVTLAQLVSPGTPVVYGSTSTNIDMRTGALAIGSPELSLMIAAHAQLARYYGLPSRSGGALTDASSPDAQAGLESMLSLLTTVASGVDFVLHAAGILSSYLALSREKLVLDDEMCGMLRHCARGIEVSPDTLAADVTAAVGPGGHFLAEAHTVERCRSAFWQPAVMDRRGLEAWMAGGRQDAVARASRRAQALISEHRDPPLDAIVERQLRAFVAEQAS